VPPAAKPSFDDSDWEVVDAPHDALITTSYSSQANNGQGSIPKNVTFYRKHFVLPAEWQGSQVHLYFDGVFSVVNVYFQGALLLNHSCGYTSFAVRLDNATGVVWGGENVLAVYADATKTTGWWYEGGGLYRNAYILRSSYPVRLADDGIFASSFTEGAFHPRADPGDGITADSATITPSISVEMDDNGPATKNVSVRVTLFAQDGITLLASSISSETPAPRGSTVIVKPPPLSINSVELWSVPRPYLHVLVASLIDEGGNVVDTMNIMLGVRTIRWDAINGMFLNEQHVKLRGFCNHNNFAGMGMGVPTRINLLRIQQMRAMGGNSWRMSHNPGNPDTFDLGDRLGMTFLDENRVFSDDPTYVENMRDMVRRDRRHPSILFYSFCNEAGCSPNTQPSLDFKLAAYDEDGSRAVTMNYFWQDIQPPGHRNATEIIDVQGFSHQSRGSFEEFHETFPEKPIGATECCSCQNQRDEDADILHNSSVRSTSNTGSCQASQTNASDGIPWAYGTYVWTAHDYYGEPGGWPHISSRFGQYDLAGFVKAPAFWFQQRWLTGVPVDDAGRPPLKVSTTVRLVELWQPPNDPNAKGMRKINVYSNAPIVRLSLNGTPVAFLSGSNGVFSSSILFSAGTLTADALAADNSTVLATHKRVSWGAPSALALTLDVPSPNSGTGAKLYLDGVDVALVRATVLDATGNIVADSTLNVSFSIESGPGLVVGVGNGDPSSLDPNQVNWRPAYHGLARGVIRATLDASTPDVIRARRLAMEVDAGKGPRSSSIMPIGGTPPTSIVVTAEAPGLPRTSLTIPLSVDASDSPMSVASASVGTADLGQ